MKAAFYTETGPAADVLRVGEIDTPDASHGEVRVRLRYSGINPSDIKSRGGTTKRAAGMSLIVPHSDGAGVIDQVGDGVPATRIGERVWVYNGQWQRDRGTAAEYIALPAQQAVALPAGVSLEAGACLGIPAMTALAAVDHARCGPGTTVLIHGGAGAVGAYAIQFARLRGASVSSTVSSAAKAAVARSAGAACVVDYRAEDVRARLLEHTAGRGVDAVIDVNFSANHALDVGLLAPHGRIVVYGAADDTAVLGLRALRGLNASLQFLRVYDLQDAARERAQTQLQAWLAAGAIEHRIARIHPLDAVALAHDELERGAVTGKVLLEIG